MSTSKPFYEDPESDPTAKERLYPELARANLLRMRGDYKGAIDQCLSILKRTPEDLDAHTLIADIYSESGDLVQSAQWYELALELAPKSVALRAKLEGVRERAQHKEIAETAEQLGLPTTDGPRMAIYGAIVVIFIVVIGITAYLLGQRHPVAKKSPLQFSINAPGTPDRPTDANSPDADNTNSSEGSSPSVGAALLPLDDRSLTLTLSQRDPLGSHIMSALSDPRSKILTINYSVRADDDVRKIGAELARSSFDQVTDAMTITVRGIRDDRLVYVADVSRDKLNDAVSTNESQGGPSDGWISGALGYEWTVTSTSSTTGAPTTATATPPATTSPSPPATSTAPKDTGTATTGG